MSNSSLTSSGAASAEHDDGFCQRFGQLLAALNISQNEFARRLGSTSAFVSNMARGKSKPGLDFLQKIATTFGVSLDWLVLGQGTLRGDAFIDAEWHHAVLLRVALARLAAAGNGEARALAAELLGDAPANPITTQERQALFDELARQTEHGPLLATLYNRFLPESDPTRRNDAALRAALQQLQAGGGDPLAALLQQAQQAQQSQQTQQPQNSDASAAVQVQIGVGNRAAGRDYHEGCKS